MALVAGLAPEELLGVGGAFSYPLCRSEDSYLRRERFAGEVARRILCYAQLFWMRGDILLKFLDDE